MCVQLKLFNANMALWRNNSDENLAGLENEEIAIGKDAYEAHNDTLAAEANVLQSDWTNNQPDLINDQVNLSAACHIPVSPPYVPPITSPTFPPGTVIAPAQASPSTTIPYAPPIGPALKAFVCQEDATFNREVTTWTDTGTEPAGLGFLEVRLTYNALEVTPSAAFTPAAQAIHGGWPAFNRSPQGTGDFTSARSEMTVACAQAK